MENGKLRISLKLKGLKVEGFMVYLADSGCSLKLQPAIHK